MAIYDSTMDDVWNVLTNQMREVEEIASGEHIYKVEKATGEVVGRVPEPVKDLERKGFAKETEQEDEERFDTRVYSLTDQGEVLMDVNPYEDNRKFVESLDDDLQTLRWVDVRTDGLHYDKDNLPEQVESLEERGLIRGYKTDQTGVKRYLVTELGREILEVR